jgi:hypothetical protein
MRTTIRRLGWLIAIWAASVLAIGVVAYALRVILKPML